MSGSGGERGGAERVRATNIAICAPVGAGGALEAEAAAEGALAVDAEGAGAVLATGAADGADDGIGGAAATSDEGAADADPGDCALRASAALCGGES